MHIVCSDKAMRDNIRKFAPGSELDILASRVSEVFNVSPASARIRITQLGYGFTESTQKTIFTIGYSNEVLSV